MLGNMVNANERERVGIVSRAGLGEQATDFKSVDRNPSWMTNTNE